MRLNFHGIILDHVVISVSRDNKYLRLLKERYPDRKNTTNARSLIYKINNVLLPLPIDVREHVIAFPKFIFVVHEHGSDYLLFHSEQNRFIYDYPEKWDSGWRWFPPDQKELKRKADVFDIGFAIPSSCWQPTPDWRPTKLIDLNL